MPNVEDIRKRVAPEEVEVPAVEAPDVELSSYDELFAESTEALEVLS